MTEIVVPNAFKGLLTQARYYVYYGGRGSAKSHSIARYLVAMSMSTQIKILCAREFQNSIADSVHALLSDVIKLHALDKYFVIKNNTIECVNGSIFIFKGLAHNVDSIKSIEGIDIVWCEEAERISDNSWNVLIPTIRKPRSRIIISFNPSMDTDPTYKRFIIDTPPDTVKQKVSWRDNPHFPEVLRLEMEHLRSVDFERYLWVWEGELRTISDAQIFKDKCVIEDFDSSDVEIFYHGMDFGFANDPSVVVRCFIKERKLYIDEAKFGYHIEINDLGKVLLDPVLKNKNYKTYADCARPETISYLSNMGYNITGTSKWSGSVEDGIEFLKSFDKIVIRPTLTDVIEEFKCYSYKVDRHTNQVLPVVLDDYNHGIDSIRYALNDMIKKKTTIFDAGVM